MDTRLWTLIVLVFVAVVRGPALVAEDRFKLTPVASGEITFFIAVAADKTC